MIYAFALLTLLFVNDISTTVATGASKSKWAHGWDTPGAGWWGYGGLGAGVMTAEQTTFVANTYSVVVLSYCPGDGNLTTAEGVQAVRCNPHCLLYTSDAADE